MKPSNKDLLKADAALLSTGIASKGVVPSAYKGAVSAFGASLVTSGLIPTLQFYMAHSDNRDADYQKILAAIARIVGQDNSTMENLKSQVMATIGIENAATRRLVTNQLKKKIIQAAIALKIMMRSYTFSAPDQAGA